MIITKIRFLKQEREAWVRTINYIQYENVFLKSCLTDIIKDGINSQMLEKAEYFQNQFVDKDTVIALLRYDIAAQHKLFEKNKEPDVNLMGMFKKQDQLRADMEKMELEFIKLKYEFGNYCAETL